MTKFLSYTPSYIDIQHGTKKLCRNFANLGRNLALRCILTFVFSAIFPVAEVNAEKKIILSGQVGTNKATAIVIQSQQISAYTEVIKGFEEGCKGENISVEAVYDLKGDAEEGKRIVQNIKNKQFKPKLILAVGILATTIVKEHFPDIPILFCMVINHERFNLQAPNITGISSEASTADQFTILKKFLGTKKNVGVIYDPMKTGKIIADANHAAKDFELNLVKAEVASESKVASALNDIINKIDVLWIVPDGTVITKDSLDTIIKVTQKHRLPTFCTSSAIVRAGALVSISPDYASTGNQAAHIAKTLLSSPTTISLGIKQPDKLKVTLNTLTEEIIGANLSSLKSRPDVVFYP